MQVLKNNNNYFIPNQMNQYAYGYNVNQTNQFNYQLQMTPIQQNFGYPQISQKPYTQSPYNGQYVQNVFIPYNNPEQQMYQFQRKGNNQMKNMRRQKPRVQVRVDQADEISDVNKPKGDNLFTSDNNKQHFPPRDQYLTVSSTASTRLNSRKNSTEQEEISINNTGTEDCQTQASDNDQDYKQKNHSTKFQQWSTQKNAQKNKLEKDDSDEFFSYEMATVKKPKRHFNNDSERENFVRQYQMKFKTEMCRNWEISGKCKFQDTCSFAHGKHELQKKSHLPQNFKTKPCTQFHETGFCPYGNRCQFLHSQFDIVTADKLDYVSILKENSRLSEERANSLKEGQDLLTYVNVFQTRRLNCFQNIIKQ